MYDKIIFILHLKGNNWVGIGKIYDIIISTIVYPFDMYASWNLYFKIFIVIIYLKITEVRDKYTGTII